MTSEEYGQYIDDFELGADVMPGESLTEYIERRRREFESKADGGMIGIEVLFGPKRDDFRVGGAAGREYGADTSASRGVRTSPSRGPSRDDRGPMLVAELTPKQKKFIDKQKFGLQENLVPARDIFNKITNPKLGIFDTGTFGFGAQEPTTEEEFNEYLKSIGVVQQVKDGGRVGFFMGGPALEGQALQIYNSMNAYGFTDQEIADALSARGLYTPAGSGSGTETTQSNIIGAQLNQDRDDGPKGDFGLFGDLLKDTEKTFTKNVYTEIGPGKFDFVPTEVTGYKNVKTGNYQTEAGKNINHLGLEIPTIAGMLFDKNFGKGPQVGDIEGTFTKGIPTNLFKNPFGIFQKQQATLKEIQDMNKKAVDELRAKQAAEKAAKEAARAAEMARYNITSGSDFGGGVPGGGGGNVTTKGGDTYGGAAFGYNEAAEKTDYFKDGGLATMFTRRR